MGSKGKYKVGDKFISRRGTIIEITEIVGKYRDSDLFVYIANAYGKDLSHSSGSYTESNIDSHFKPLTPASETLWGQN